MDEAMLWLKMRAALAGEFFTHMIAHRNTISPVAKYAYEVGLIYEAIPLTYIFPPPSALVDDAAAQRLISKFTAS
jgi:hypothetical protein